LQPIVENAIRHGVSRSEERGRIEVPARRVNGMLRLQVADNGPGLDGRLDVPSHSAEGLGLANTKARLQNLYGNAHRFELTEAKGSRLVVTMQIPFEVAAPRQAQRGRRVLSLNQLLSPGASLTLDGCAATGPLVPLQVPPVPPPRRT
jgi:signal transduction histidine kinase